MVYSLKMNPVSLYKTIFSFPTSRIVGFPYKIKYPLFISVLSHEGNGLWDSRA